MKNSSPLIPCSGVLLSKNKLKKNKKTKPYKHFLEFASNRKIYNPLLLRREGERDWY